MAAVMGIGTATFLPGYGPTAGGHPGPALLTAAFDHDVRYVDTAAAYGSSEAALGEVADQVRSRGVRVATKIQPAAHTVEAYRTATDASLARLRLAAIDTVLLHSAASSLIASPVVAEAWSGVREARIARHVGVSTYGVADARTAVTSSWCETVQVEFSIVNQAVVGALRAAASRPCEVIVRSVLCKGLLTSSAFALTLPKDALETLRALEALGKRLHMDLTTLAIRFALDTPGIDVVLVGVSDAAELDAAVRAWRRAPLSVPEYAEIAAFDRSHADWAHPERWPGGRPAA
jgi:aryl-alcohol dehydrogenase-like predicted oxidoreductase